MNNPTTHFEAWHFLADSRQLRDGTPAIVGKTYTVAPLLVLCEHGLHFSLRAFDALGYSPGPIICRVRISGEKVIEGDKGCSTERTILSMADATDTLRAFSRWCALQAIHLWDCPPIVKQYLETGDESIRDAAWAAARAAAWDAAWDAARAAARAAAWAAAWDAAWDAARAAAWDAARDAAWAAAWAAAWDAARDAAWAAFIDKANAKLEQDLLQLLGQAVAA